MGLHALDPLRVMWHDVDMWRHKESRHGPMRAHVGAYVVQESIGLCIVGPPV